MNRRNFANPNAPKQKSAKANAMLYK